MLQWGAACRPFILNGSGISCLLLCFCILGSIIFTNLWQYCCFMGDMVENAVGHKYLTIYLGSQDWWVILLSLYMDISRQATLSALGASGRSMELSVEFLF